MAIAYLSEKRKLGFTEEIIRFKVTYVVPIDTEFEPRSDSKAHSILDCGVNLKVCPQ